MGLGVTHGCWHGAYSAFSRWRDDLCVAAGLPMAEMEVYPGFKKLAVDIPWERFEDKNFQGDWDTPPDDPLFLLIVHSDCDGRIPAEYCDHLANRLEQLVDKLSPDTGVSHYHSPKAQTQQFINGLRKAAAAGEDVEFG